MTLYDRPRLQVLVADKDLTDRCDSIVFSATDSGGYEIATLGLPSADRPKKGAGITIRQGLEVAWQGRVAEIADHSQHGRATKTTGCEGLRALLRDTLVQMVYVDRDLSRWQGPTIGRQIAVSGLGALDGPQVGADPVSATPALLFSATGPWTTASRIDGYYDAGLTNLLASVYMTVSTNSRMSASFAETLYCTANPDVTTTTLLALTLAASSSASQYTTVSPQTRYLFFENFFSGTAGDAAGPYTAYLTNFAAYGNHGLTGRGSDPVGFYPSDIARHALSQCANVSAGEIVDATGYIAPHVVYRTPTPADVIVDDMARLMGWPWGVWEPSTVLGSGPRLDFGPPPTDATCVVSKAECDQLDVTSRLGDLYNTCTVTYSDPAGSQGSATVTLPNTQLNEAGVATRTLLLDMGLGSQAAATTFANFALALSQVAARAAGQATLPVSVRLPGGGHKPACLIRPGADRLRITDLLDAGPLLDLGTVRRDVFRISRVETTVGKDGTPSTRVELDSGSNLLETLQARLAIAAGVVGSGASGG